MKRIRNMLSYIKQIGEYSVNSVEVSIIKSMCLSVLPFVNIFFSSKIIDFLKDKNENYLTIYIVMALLINAILLLISRVFCEIERKKAVEIRNNEIRVIIERLMKTDYENLENKSINDSIKRIINDMQEYFCLHGRLLILISESFNGILTIFFSTCLLLPVLLNDVKSESFFATNHFTFMVFILIVFAVAAVFLLSKKLSDKWEKFTIDNLELNNYLIYFMDFVTNYKAVKEIRLFENSKYIKKYATEEMVEKGTLLQKKITNHSAISSSIIAVIAGIIGLGVYLFVGLRGKVGLFSVGRLVLYLGAFMMLINGIMKLAAVAGKFSNTVKVLDLFNSLLNTPEKMIYGIENCFNYENVTIEFNDITFKYPNSEKYVLKNLNLKINAGEKIALVGKNGCGKSTLVKLLCRLYEPENGSILINNIDIRQYKKESCQNLFSTVFQDYSIYSLPIYQNVTANDNYSKDKLYDSMQRADILSYVQSLHNKENTFLFRDIDEEGIEISGGEAQKLALARALYKDAPIVILDEPSASLDAISEYNMFSYFASFLKNKTTIYISHRLSSCTFCDRVIVLKDGEIVEEGSHKDLLQNVNGYYSKLWESQASHYI